MRAAFLSVRAPPPLFPFCAGREYIPHGADGPSPVRRLFPGCAACTRDAVCGLRTTESCRRDFKIRLFELLLTRLIEIPIVRTPFGKSTDFLESIPSKFLIFFQSPPAAGPVDVCSEVNNRQMLPLLTGSEPPTPSKRK